MGGLVYEAEVVANSLLQRGFKEGRADLSPMKLQKLMFFLNGWYLAIHGRPAIVQPFEAWEYGPVIKSIYQSLKQYRSGTVTEYLKTFDPVSSSHNAFVVSDSDREFHEVLDLTWEKYIGIPALQLSAMTHSPGSPWDKIRRAQRSIIDNETTKEYFVGLATTGTAVAKAG